MGGVLPTEHGVLLGHPRLDEGVADPGADRPAALLADELRHRLGGDEVVDDRRARVLVEIALGDDAADRRGAHGLAQLIDDEAPVGVTVEGDADVGLLLDGVLLQVDEVLRIQRVGLVVREGAVELEVERIHRERRLGAEHRRGTEPAHPVARVDGDGQRPDVQRHQLLQVGRVVVEHILLRGAAFGPVVGGDAVDEHVDDLRQTGLLPHRAGAGTAHLDAVVLRRVVRGGEHRTGAVERARGEVQLVGGGQPERGAVQSLRTHPLGERRREVRGARPHVVADDHRGRPFTPHEVGEGRPGVADEVRVDAVTDDASDVVGLDDGGE